MRIQPLLQCVRTLDFNPEQDWSPVLPAYSWRKILLTGFDRSEGEAVDLFEGREKPMSFAQAFVACYQKLSLPELSRLRICLAQTNIFIPVESSWPEIIRHYGFQNIALLDQTLVQLNQTPRAFHDWVSRRALNPGDLAVLRLISDFQTIEILLLKLTKMNPSKSTGVQCLEIALELFLRGKDPQEILPQAAHAMNGEDWLKQLLSMRNPQITQRDSETSEKLMQLPWPSQLQTRWMRSGDRAGIEVRFVCSSADELKKKIDALSQTYQIWQQQESIRGKSDLEV